MMGEEDEVSDGSDKEKLSVRSYRGKVSQTYHGSVSDTRFVCICKESN
jgi:hypothetical protein